jgi:hypothetical protein
MEFEKQIKKLKKQGINSIQKLKLKKRIDLCISYVKTNPHKVYDESYLKLLQSHRDSLNSLQLDKQERALLVESAENAVGLVAKEIDAYLRG